MYENQAPLQMSRDIYFGSGMRFTLGEKLAERGCRKPFVVFDKGIAALGIGDQIVEILWNTKDTKKNWKNCRKRQGFQKQS